MSDKTRPLNVISNVDKVGELRRAFEKDSPAKQEESPAKQENAPLEVAPPGSTAEQIELRRRVIAVLETIFDPEIPVNLYDLGLIYGIDIDDKLNVHIRMTLTTPGCPVAGTLPGEIQQKVRLGTGAPDVKVELVWDPPWTKERMSEAALLELGLL